MHIRKKCDKFYKKIIDLQSISTYFHLFKGTRFEIICVYEK